MVEIASLVLFADDLEHTAAFYRALGLPLDDEDHGEGARHLAAEFGGLHFAVYAASDAGAPTGAGGRAPGWRERGSSFPGFWVTSLEDTLAALTGNGAPVLAGHEAMPWGCRVVVKDPDGRAVEINERGHCLA